MRALADELRERLLKGGACAVGYGSLAELPADQRQGLPVGISIAVSLNPEIVRSLPTGPSPEYHAEYKRLNALLDALADDAAAFLQARGYRAVPLPASTFAGIDRPTLSMPLPHKTVATRAGMGWIGKCALLVTPEFGSAVRIASVLTDAPLPAAAPVNESRCSVCRACALVCPAGAPSGEEWAPGVAREAFFDAFACFRAARELSAAQGIEATICGRCIVACPWTQRWLGKHPDMRRSA
jgi:epoxyqueuosine reductase